MQDLKAWLLRRHGGNEPKDNAKAPAEPSGQETVTEEEYRILRYICEQGVVDYDHLYDIFPEMSARRSIHNVTHRKLAVVDYDTFLCRPNVTPADLKKLEKLYPNAPRPRHFPKMTDEELHIMLIIHEMGAVSVQLLVNQFPDYPMEQIISQLTAWKYIRQDTLGTVMLKSSIDEELYEILSDLHNGEGAPRIWRAFDNVTFRLMYKHWQEHPDYPCIDYSELKELTCVPDSICRAVAYLGREGHVPTSQLQNLPTGSLSMVSLNDFFLRNDYATKEQWVDAYRKELARIQKMTFLPDRVIQAFETALKELEEEYPLEIILEIRRRLLESDAGE